MTSQVVQRTTWLVGEQQKSYKNSTSEKEVVLINKHKSIKINPVVCNNKIKPVVFQKWGKPRSCTQQRGKPCSSKEQRGKLNYFENTLTNTASSIPP